MFYQPLGYLFLTIEPPKLYDTSHHISGRNTVERPQECQGENADARKATRAPDRVFKFPDSPES